MPIKSVKSFSNIYFHGQVSSKRFFVQNIDSFRGYADAVLDAPSFDETSLLCGNDSRHDFREPICQNLGDEFEFEVCNGYRPVISHLLCMVSFWNKNNII